MSESKPLSRRQLAVIDDLFTTEMGEQDVLDKHNVSSAMYDRWLADERFSQYYERRVTRAYREARVLLARYARLAASRLVHLANDGDGETARKACLDIVAPRTIADATAAPTGAEDNTSYVELPPEIASRLLAALAEGSEGNTSRSTQTSR